MISEGKTEQEVLAAKVTAPYDAKIPGGLLPAGAGTSADRFVSMVYSQLKAGRWVRRCGKRAQSRSPLVSERNTFRVQT